MIYFYAGLGTAMPAAIMVVFELGLALNGNSLISSDDASNMQYQQTAHTYDRLFLDMISRREDLALIGSGRSGQGLCRQIMCRIKGIDCRLGNTKAERYQGLQKYDDRVLTPATGLWSSACVLEGPLEGNDVLHRVMIRPGQDGLRSKYQLYSCVIESSDSDPRCLFEQRR